MISDWMFLPRVCCRNTSTAQRSNGLLVVRAFKNSCGRDNNLRARGANLGRVFSSDAAVDFEQKIAAEELARFAVFGQALGHHFLAAESGIDGHNKEHFNLASVVLSGLDRRGRLDRERG